MCGIVGLLAKTTQAREHLGQWLAPMFTCMSARGPDSGGLAVFREPVDAPRKKYSLCANDRHYAWDQFGEALQAKLASTAMDTDSLDLVHRENHAIISVQIDRQVLIRLIDEIDSTLHVLSAGSAMDVFKDQGAPEEIAARYQFGEIQGTHGVGHTRMATESAVTPEHSHPFTAGEDFCLVHNGSLSNPYMLRRMLENEGLHFDTDNDTEAACRYIEWQLRSGKDLAEALQLAFRDLDGFYTLLMATRDRMTLVRDAFACKPAVVAETDDYVAVASEFRALAHLPGVDEARMFEPAPEEIYTWQV